MYSQPFKDQTSFTNHNVCIKKSQFGSRIPCKLTIHPFNTASDVLESILVCNKRIYLWDISDFFPVPKHVSTTFFNGSFSGDFSLNAGMHLKIDGRQKC